MKRYVCRYICCWLLPILFTQCHLISDAPRKVILMRELSNQEDVYRDSLEQIPEPAGHIVNRE